MVVVGIAPPPSSHLAPSDIDSMTERIHQNRGLPTKLVETYARLPHIQ